MHSDHTVTESATMDCKVYSCDNANNVHPSVPSLLPDTLQQGTLTKQYQKCLSKEIYIHTQWWTKINSIHWPDNSPQDELSQPKPLQQLNSNPLTVTKSTCPPLSAQFSRQSSKITALHHNRITFPAFYNDSFPHQNFACISCISLRYLTDFQKY
jgi:hypothetical protein